MRTPITLDTPRNNKRQVSNLLDSLGYTDVKFGAYGNRLFGFGFYLSVYPAGDQYWEVYQALIDNGYSMR